MRDLVKAVGIPPQHRQRAERGALKKVGVQFLNHKRPGVRLKG